MRAVDPKVRLYPQCVLGELRTELVKTKLHPVRQQVLSALRVPSILPERQTQMATVSDDRRGIEARVAFCDRSAERPRSQRNGGQCQRQ